MLNLNGRDFYVDPLGINGLGGIHLSSVSSGPIPVKEVATGTKENIHFFRSNLVCVIEGLTCDLSFESDGTMSAFSKSWHADRYKHGDTGVVVLFADTGIQERPPLHVARSRDVANELRRISQQLSPDLRREYFPKGLGKGIVRSFDEAYVRAIHGQMDVTEFEAIQREIADRLVSRHTLLSHLHKPGVAICMDNYVHAIHGPDSQVVHRRSADLANGEDPALKKLLLKEAL